MARQNKERIFLTELKHSFEEHGAFWHKIMDAPIFKGMTTRFNKGKPFDAFMVYQGIPIAIEAKYLPDYKSFGMANMRPSQIEGLENFEKIGLGESFVFLNVRRKGRGILNSMLIFTWNEMKEKKKFGKAELQVRPQWSGAKQRFPVDYFLRSFL